MLLYVYRKSTAHTALVALNWSCLLYEIGSKKKEDVVKHEIGKVVEAQAVLLTAVVSVDNSKILNKAYSLVGVIIIT